MKIFCGILLKIHINGQERLITVLYETLCNAVDLRSGAIQEKTVMTAAAGLLWILCGKTVFISL